MKRFDLAALGVFVLLVALGVSGRLLLREIPNFTPTMAVAFFAAFYFRRAVVAACVPLVVLAISNIWIGPYGSWGVMATVFLSLLLPVALRPLLRKRIESPAGLLRMAVCLLSPTLFFYLTTNLAVWWFQDLYPRSGAGLIACYVQALPFYKWMLQADLLFLPLLFGGYVGVNSAPQIAAALAAFCSAALKGRKGLRPAYRPLPVSPRA